MLIEKDWSRRIQFSSQYYFSMPFKGRRLQWWSQIFAFVTVCLFDCVFVYNCDVQYVCRWCHGHCMKESHTQLNCLFLGRRRWWWYSRDGPFIFYLTAFQRKREQKEHGKAKNGCSKMVEHMSQNQKVVGLMQTANHKLLSWINLNSLLIYLDKQWLYVPNAKLSIVS